MRPARRLARAAVATREPRSWPHDEALELAFFTGMSHREIAAVTSAPLGTVKTRLELGLQKLTQSLRPIRHKI